MLIRGFKVVYKQPPTTSGSNVVYGSTPTSASSGYWYLSGSESTMTRTKTDSEIIAELPRYAVRYPELLERDCLLREMYKVGLVNGEWRLGDEKEQKKRMYKEREREQWKLRGRR